MQEVDTNGDGRVSFEEFLQFASKVRELERRRRYERVVALRRHC